MNELKNNDSYLPAVKMWNGQRVVTLADIDAVHHREKGIAKKNFDNNKKHFILNADYFEITRKELHENFTPNSKLVGNPQITTYLLTESGYLMIVKSFTDDLSWSVQRQLVNNYFKVPAKAMKPAQPQIKQTSNAIIPPPKDWYSINKQLVWDLCHALNIDVKKLYGYIFRDVGKKYDLNYAEKLYTQETGMPVFYTMEVISYFEQLSQAATEYCEYLLMKYGE